MKKVVPILLFMSVLFSMFANVGQAATATPKIYLNGVELVPLVAPEIVGKGYTIVPIRLISESVGYQVIWAASTQTVTIHNGDDTIVLTINKDTALVNNQQVKLDTPAVVKKGTTLVPLRFIGDQLGMTVNWDNETKSVILLKDMGETIPGEVGTETPGTTEPTGLLTSIQYDEQNSVLLTYEGVLTASKPQVLSNPTRLVFDFVNTGYSDQFTPAIEAGKSTGEIAVASHPTITKIRYSLFSTTPSTARVVLDLTDASDYEIIEGTGQYRIKVTKSSVTPPTTTPGDSGSGTGSKVYTIVLDAGHGAKDPGAQSILSGKWEKETNLKITLKVKALLDKEKYITPLLTRSDDTFIELSDRAKIANNAKADLFISFHANSATSSTVTGTETYYSRANSKDFATVIHKYLLKGTGLKDRGVKTANYRVIKDTTMPAILLESGFLTNKGDSEILFSDTAQSKIAAQIVAGIKEYLKLS